MAEAREAKQPLPKTSRRRCLWTSFCIHLIFSIVVKGVLKNVKCSDSKETKKYNNQSSSFSVWKQKPKKTIGCHAEEIHLTYAWNKLKLFFPVERHSFGNQKKVFSWLQVIKAGFNELGESTVQVPLQVQFSSQVLKGRTFIIWATRLKV